MRIDFTPDVPHDLPRNEQPQQAPVPPLEASPIEQRRDSLQELERLRRMPRIPRPEYKHEQKARPVLRHDQERPVERRPRRDLLPKIAIDVSLRPEEQVALREIARFRVLTTRDIADTIYGLDRMAQMQDDLRFLEQRGLVSLDSVNARRDGRGGRVERIEVVSLTKAGRDLARQISGLPEDQKLYAGMVKPREVEHDTQIYRAYLKEAEHIEKDGGTNLRVRLDFELKASIQKAIYAERKANPTRKLNDTKQQVAREMDLPFVNGGIQIPDARIEYDLTPKNGHDLDEGSRTGHQDIEVLTAAYRPGQLRSKAQAGFHVYASRSDRATLTAKVEGDHHLLDNILEL